MITWAAFPFVRLTPALILGIVAYLYLGADWPELWPWATALAIVSGGLILWATRRYDKAATDLAGLLGLLTVAVLGATLTQRSVESRRADHLGRFGDRVQAYRAVVNDYTVARPKTYATTLLVREVRVNGRWQAATGSIRISLPRVAGIAAPHYGQVWLVRGHPDLSKSPLNPGEFDYRRYLEYRQVYHQQYIHPDQYRILGLAPPSTLVALSMRAATVLDGVFRHYIKEKREYAIASALVLGIKDDVDVGTKQAYLATGTTHIMAVSGLQVGLLFAALNWVLRGLFGRVRGFRLWSAGVGLAVIWTYAFVTGLSASVLRATVMFSFVIVGRAMQRQDTIFNTLGVAAFCLLVYNPFLVADVGFQLSFLAVLSIVYLQPRISKWVDLKYYFNGRRRPWQPQPVQWAWRGTGWVSQKIWEATALSLAAQVATFPLGLFYFHQFPFSFLFSNLVAVPISSGSVYVGLGLLALKGLLALLVLVLPKLVNHWLDYLPQAVAWVFEKMVWLFNEYIFWIARVMPGAVVREVHLSALQTLLIFAMLGAVLAWASTRRLAWLRWTAAAALAYAGSRVAEARTVAPDNEFVVYSIPRRSALGFWAGRGGGVRHPRQHSAQRNRAHLSSPARTDSPAGPPCHLLPRLARLPPARAAAGRPRQRPPAPLAAPRPHAAYHLAGPANRSRGRSHFQRYRAHATRCAGAASQRPRETRNPGGGVRAANAGGVRFKLQNLVRRPPRFGPESKRLSHLGRDRARGLPAASAPLNGVVRRLFSVVKPLNCQGILAGSRSANSGLTTKKVVGPRRSIPPQATRPGF